MKIPKIHNPLFIAVVATLGGMLFGFDISSMSAIILTDQYRNFSTTLVELNKEPLGLHLLLAPYVAQRSLDLFLIGLDVVILCFTLAFSGLLVQCFRLLLMGLVCLLLVEYLMVCIGRWHRHHVLLR